MIAECLAKELEKVNLEEEEEELEELSITAGQQLEEDFAKEFEIEIEI